MNTLSVLGIILLMLAGIGTVSAVTIQNHGFETPIVTGNFATYDSLTNLGGWEVNHIDLVTGSYWKAAELSQSIDLSSTQRGSISQTISAPAGSYQLLFSMSGNPECGPVQKQVRVSWGVTVIGNPAFDSSVINPTVPIGDMKWVKVSLPFTATGADTILKFEDISEGVSNCGVVLDDIAIQPIVATPEFPAVALPAALIIGLLGAILFIKSTKEN